MVRRDLNWLFIDLEKKELQFEKKLDFLLCYV
jgi:hypothetical protein